MATIINPLSIPQRYSPNATIDDYFSLLFHSYFLHIFYYSQFLNVTVPLEVGPGQVIPVQTPDGKLYNCLVPLNGSPGLVIQFEVPPGAQVDEFG